MPTAIVSTNEHPTATDAGPPPWLRLGRRLDTPGTAADAVRAAGLDFAVELQQLKTDGDLRVPRRRAVVRRDTRTVLGVVSRSYQPVQNHQAFSFLDSVVAGGGLCYETAGALGKGERVWMLAKLPGDIRVRGSEDVTNKYLLLANSHDGSSALRVLFTPIRVVCQNTLNLALRQGRGEGITIQHKGNLQAKVREARQVLGLADRTFNDYAEKADFLAGHSPTPALLDSFFKTLLPDPNEGNPARAQNVRRRLVELFESGRGQDIPQVKGTYWAAFNAVTEWQDHFRPTRGRDDDDRVNNRLESSWFGSGSILKSRAFDLALSMAAGEIPAAIAA